VTHPRAIAEPSACRHCDIPYREHYQQWTQAAGRHQWTAPTDSQMLARMLARRASRTTTDRRPR
jgi:hypothetical protein